MSNLPRLQSKKLTSVGATLCTCSTVLSSRYVVELTFVVSSTRSIFLSRVVHLLAISSNFHRHRPFYRRCPRIWPQPWFRTFNWPHGIDGALLQIRSRLQITIWWSVRDPAAIWWGWSSDDSVVEIPRSQLTAMYAFLYIAQKLMFKLEFLENSLFLAFKLVKTLFTTVLSLLRLYASVKKIIANTLDPPLTPPTALNLPANVQFINVIFLFQVQSHTIPMTINQKKNPPSLHYPLLNQETTDVLRFMTPLHQ